MKKLVSIIVAAMMIAPSFALADAAPESTPAAYTQGGTAVYDYTTEITYDGYYYQFTDDNFQLLLPNDWVEIEISDDLAETGIYALVGTEDKSIMMAVQYVPNEDCNFDDLLATMISDENNTNVSAGMLSGVSYIAYTDISRDMFGAATIDSTNSGYINFMFSPFSNDETASYAAQILSSICAIDATAETGVEIETDGAQG